MESRAQSVVQSDSPVALCAFVKLSSPKVLLVAGIALVLDQLSAEHLFAQHVQGVLKFHALGRLSQGAFARVSLLNVTSLCASEHRFVFRQLGASKSLDTCVGTARSCVSLRRSLVEGKRVLF